jgi:hypothetical protein
MCDFSHTISVVPCRSALIGSNHHSALLSLKSFNFYHEFHDEILEIGIIYPNLIEKSHHSTNPGQNPEQ